MTTNQPACVGSAVPKIPQLKASRMGWLEAGTVFKVAVLALFVGGSGAGAAVILHKPPCSRLIARRALYENHLLVAGDWGPNTPNALACTAERTVEGRYMNRPVLEGDTFAYSDTLEKPRLAVTAGHVLFWVRVPPSIVTTFLEPRAELELCDGADCGAPLEVAALRCALVDKKQACDIAVISSEERATGIRKKLAKSFVIRLLATAPAAKGSAHSKPGEKSSVTQPSQTPNATRDLGIWDESED